LLCVAAIGLLTAATAYLEFGLLAMAMSHSRPTTTVLINQMWIASVCSMASILAVIVAWKRRKLSWRRFGGGLILILCSLVCGVVLIVTNRGEWEPSGVLFSSLAGAFLVAAGWVLLAAQRGIAASGAPPRR
jgi:SNF family Na+-dependent transporter